MQRCTYLFFLAILLPGCQQDPQLNGTKVYYDINGFVNRQITQLNARQPTVRKQIELEGEKTSQQTQTLNWQRELELFLQADINKPALRSSYAINRPDSLTFDYRLKSSEEKPTVRALRVQLDPATRQPKRIEATLKTENPLYHSERILLLESSLVGSAWQVTHYKVSGFQQLTYFERKDILVEGRVQ